MKYRIIMDSAGEIPVEFLNDPSYVSVPLTLTIGEEDILDDGHVDQITLVEKIAASPVCPKTACPSPGAYLDAMDCDAERIYVLTISAELSGSYQSAMTAREMYLEDHPDAKVHVFNSRSTSVGETILLYMIKEREEAGIPYAETVRELEHYIDTRHTYFVLDNLETLRKNGRLSRMKALAANVLKIKPVCGSTPEGAIEQFAQARGTNKALVKMVELAVERCLLPEHRILGISYVNCKERAIMVRDAVLQRIKVKQVLLQETGGLSTVYANDGGIILVI